MKYAIALVALVMAAALALPLALAAIFFSPALVLAAPFAVAVGQPRLLPAAPRRAKSVAEQGRLSETTWAGGQTPGG
jgi:hypothetical protein